MATLAGGLRHLRCPRQLAGFAARRQPWPQPARQPAGLRALNTDASAGPTSEQEKLAHVNAVHVPHQEVKHARQVPASPSYFSREPSFDDLHIRLLKLLVRYQALPTVRSQNAPAMSWSDLGEIRAQIGEPIRAAHFAQVRRIAKRLNLIEPDMRPREVQAVLELFTRDINPALNVPRPLKIDPYGRAIAAGRRKEATARAFVVEGTGEINVNGKPLNDMFGRVHDRESAVWPLTSTQRLDKYNVWALVEGGGTTGQAEALTLAIAKALVAHEPALKTALRKAGCITRDPRMVERKKHGRQKARKGQTWVKR